MWNPVFLLPNLRIEQEVSVGEAAIVPMGDPRVQLYSKQYPEFLAFVRKFTDPFGVKCARRRRISLEHLAAGRLFAAVTSKSLPQARPATGSDRRPSN